MLVLAVFKVLLLLVCMLRVALWSILAVVWSMITSVVVWVLVKILLLLLLLLALLLRRVLVGRAVCIRLLIWVWLSRGTAGLLRIEAWFV